MIKIYISALLVVLLASAQTAHADQGTEDVFAQLDAANAAGQADGESADAEAAGAGQEAEMFDSLFEKGVARYEEGSFDEALLIFDAVLAINQYHAGAISYQKRAAKGVYSREDKNKKIARVEAMAEVEAAWNAEPKVFGTVEEYEVEATSNPDQEAVDQVIARLKATKIPVFDMAEATVEEVVQFFAETSRKESGAGEDVDILLVGMESADAENNITVSVDDMSLYEALQYVVEMASLKFEIRQNVVIIMPANYVPASKMVMKSYDVIPEVGSDLEAAADSAGGESDLFDSPAVDSAAGPIDVSGFFALVEFPEGTSAVYQPRFHKLFVKNTPSNLKAVEAVLADLSEEAVKRRSQQVEIETKFVEFNEGALAELGFDWTVYGSGSVAGMTMDDSGAYYKESSGYQQSTPVANNVGLGGTLYTDPVSGQQFITEPNDRAGQNVYGDSQRSNEQVYDDVTSGILSTMGGVPAAMVFENGDVDLRITAMEQEGTADVLSAPRVTTKSGAEAIIRVAETHRYPQDYDVETGQQTAPIIRPQDWDDVDMGISLKVTPVVDSEAGTIELELSPEILVFVGFDNYRAGLNAYDRSGTTTIVPGGDGSPLLARMAAFDRRSVETQMIVADGQTVMMGGLVSERTETFRDQVPLLGDIPYLGRLFRTEGSRNAKKNLTIFVKASLVDLRGMTSADRELARQ